MQRARLHVVTYTLGGKVREIWIEKIIEAYVHTAARNVARRVIHHCYFAFTMHLLVQTLIAVHQFPNVLADLCVSYLPQYASDALHLPLFQFGSVAAVLVSMTLIYTGPLAKRCVVLYCRILHCK